METKTAGDVEYHVSLTGRDNAEITTSFDRAREIAFTYLFSRGEAVIDVVIWSEEGARRYGGDDAVKQYREDPEASVFERYELKCNAAGRIP